MPEDCTKEGASSYKFRHPLLGVQESLAMIISRLDASDAAMASRLDAAMASRLAAMASRLKASDACLAGLTLQMTDCMHRLAGVEERRVRYRQLAEDQARTDHASDDDGDDE